MIYAQIKDAYMALRNPYGNGNTRISKLQWNKLNDFYKLIDPPAQNELYASGDHYTLALMLKQELGFTIPDDAFDIYQMAEVLLLTGWDGDGRNNWKDNFK